MATETTSQTSPVPDARAFELRVTPDRTQLFAFGAITWNRHKIHFDRAQAQAEGFADVVVQRGLLGNFLARSVSAWAGPRARIERLTWKVLRSTFPDHELRCQGEVTAVAEERGERLVDCALRIVNPEGHHIADGAARVRFR